MDDGTIEITGWVERRRYARWMIAWPVMLLNGPTAAAAQIVNISLGGFGLVAAEPLQVDEQICVELPTGRRLFGTVKWARSGHYGIKLATPLRSTDALVAAAQSDSER